METKSKLRLVLRISENIIVHEVDLRISSIINNKKFEAKGAFIISVEKFNMHLQKYLGLQHVNHNGLKLADIRAEDIRVLIGAQFTEAFHQLDIKSRDKGEPIGIKTPFGWAEFGSKCACKSNINQTSVNCYNVAHKRLNMLKQ